MQCGLRELPERRTRRVLRQERMGTQREGRSGRGMRSARRERVGDDCEHRYCEASRERPEVTRGPGPGGSPCPAPGRAARGHSGAAVGQRGLRPEVPRARAGPRLAAQPTQPSRDRRTQPHDARAESSSASNASISGGTSSRGLGGPPRRRHRRKFTERNRRNRRNRRFSMTANELRASNPRRPRRFSRRRRGRAPPASPRAAGRRRQSRHGSFLGHTSKLGCP